MTTLPLLKTALENAKVVKMGKYEYFINPLQGVAAPLEANFLKEISKRISEIADRDVDKIVAIEAMGIHISALVSSISNKPLVIVRKKRFNLPGEMEVVVEKSYRKIAGGEREDRFYINSIREGDRVIVIDDVISTGGTMAGILKGLLKIGAIVKDVIIVMNRGDGPERIRRETGCNVRTLADVEVRDGKVHILRID